MSDELPFLLLGAALTAARRSRGLKAQDLALRLGLARPRLSQIETGGCEPTPRQLAAILAELDYTAESLAELVDDLARSTARASEAATGLDPNREERRHIRRVGAASRRSVEDFLERFTREARVRRARQEAEEDVRRLLACTTPERRVLVERLPAYQSWAAVERLCWESERQSASDPDKALALAHLAGRAAERSEPEGPRRARICAYARAYLGNALRVKNDHAGARKAFAQAWELWRQGAAANLPLEEWRLLDLESSLLVCSRRLDLAMEKLRQAVSLAPQATPTSILLKRAHVWSQKGEHEKALADLEAAALRMDEHLEPRNVFAFHFNRAATMHRLERYEEASRLLPEVRARVAELGQEIDLARTLWLEGVVAAGLGRVEEALAALAQVEAEFRRRGMAFDGALVNLDIAELELAQGKTAEVKERAVAMWWIFRDRGIHREALAALQLFCEAARDEMATVGLARRVKAYLERAREDPEMRFAG